MPLVAATSADIRAPRRGELRGSRRNAVLGFLGSSLICWTIWFAVNIENGIDLSKDFPWPLIVMAATLVNVVRTVAMRQQITADEVRRLERRQAKELQRKQRDQ